MPTPARVVVLEDYGVLAIQEIRLPDPRPHQATLSILAAGCQWAQVYQVQKPPHEATVLGREATARVLAAGSAVTRVKPGDLVVVSPWPADAGRASEATTVEFADGTSRDVAGAWTWGTNTVLDEQFLTRLPPLQDADAASVLGDTALGAYTAVMRTGAFREGQKVAVIGAAGSGLAAIALAKAAGAAAIIAVDRDNERLGRALVLGATHTVNAPAQQAVAEIRRLTGGGVDLLVDCLDDFSAVERPGAGPLRPGGRAVLLGAPVSDVRLAATATGAYLDHPPDSRDIPDLLRLVEAGNFDPRSIVTKRWTIEAVNEAVARLENGEVVGQSLIVVEPLK